MKGLKSGGQYYGYTDTPTGVFPPSASFSGQAAEVWPIDLPSGVSLQPYDGVPVIIYAASATSAPLIQVIPGATAGQTVIHKVYLVGGGTAVSANHAHAQSQSVRVSECTLVENSTGISAVASGAGDIDLEVISCSIRPDNGLLSHVSPATSNPTIGVRLHADGSSGTAPHVDATIAGLDVKNGFAIGSTTSGNPWNYGYTPWPDLEEIFASGESPSRIIDVYSTGVIREHGGGFPAKIPEVILDVAGSQLRGSGGQWDIGVYTSTEAEGSATAGDYHAGWRLSITGCAVESLGAAGICLTVGRYSRGAAWISGATSVTGTGASSQTSAPSAAYSGIHATSHQGMLSVNCSGISSSDNVGAGLYAYSEETPAITDVYPVGLFVDLSESEFHGNGACGVLLSAGQSYVNLLRDSALSIVGGTWRDTSSGSAVRTLSPWGDASILPSGIGSIDRCAISNNEDFGIMFHAGNNNQSQANYVACSVTNSIIWNNALGGVFGLSNKGTPAVSTGMTMLAPVVHNTVVGNGSPGMTNPYAPFSGGLTNADFSVEFYEHNSLPSGTQATAYEWKDPVATSDVATVLFNNIFDRMGAGTSDYGPFVEILDSAYSAPLSIPTLFPQRIRVAGNRGIATTGQPPLMPGAVGATVQYLTGSPVLTSRTASQFFLANAGPNNVLTSTSNFTQFAANRTMVDYSSTARSSVPGQFPALPELGADEY